MIFCVSSSRNDGQEEPDCDSDQLPVPAPTNSHRRTATPEDADDDPEEPKGRLRCSEMLFIESLWWCLIELWTFESNTKGGQRVSGFN